MIRVGAVSVILLTGCTLGGTGGGYGASDWESGCTDHPYRHSAAMAGYNEQTAMNEELREFWAEDRRFYEERGGEPCDD